MKGKYIILIAVSAFIAGFIMGRQTIEDGAAVVYRTGEPQQGSAAIPAPSVSYPAQPVLPVKTVYVPQPYAVHDTVKVITVVDTAAIILDYIALRQYDITLFDREDTGALDITATVQYNSLQGLSYNLTPVQKTITRSRVWVPFVGLGYNSFSQIYLSGGLFYHDMALEILYIRGLTDSRHAWGIGVKKKI
jgi:hypothetical protein